MRGQGIDLDLLLKEATDLQEKAQQQITLSEAKQIKFRRDLNKNSTTQTKEENKTKVDDHADFLKQKEDLENKFLNSQLDKQTQHQQLTQYQKVQHY